MKKAVYLYASSALLVLPAGAWAQTGQPTQVPPASTPGGPEAPATTAEQPLPPNADQDQAATTAVEPTAASSEVVVTGIRSSLERAAQIKQNAIQVVDSIVAQDIGKLPDPTTAAALQRVPGIQVSVNRNNELGDVRVRGLPDVLTTVNGREVFTTTGRTFSLQDLPAEALSRVDVFKSQSPDLIEGGLAGVIDLELNKPFNFNKPTVVLSARGNYGIRSDKADPQIGALATHRWDTPIGEIGALLNATFSRNSYERDETILSGLRSSAATPLSTPGYLIPNILQNFPEQGRLKRTQVNGALQWQVTPALQAYVEGFYTDAKDRGAHYGANIQPFTTKVTLSNVVASDNCFQSRVTAAGQNPTIQTDANGVRTLQPFTVQNLCYVKSATFNNLVANQTTQARDSDQQNKQIAGGLKYDQDGVKGVLDVSYQTSSNDTTGIVVDIGQRLPSLTLVPDNDGIASYTVPGNGLLTTDNLYIRNSFQQNYTTTRGDLFQAKADGEKDLNGILKSLRFGVRYARRSANTSALVLNTPIPGGNLGTASEATAVKVSATGLPADFLSIGSPAPDLNGGSAFYVPNPNFLLSGQGLDALRTYFRLPTGTPAFQKDREFDATEKTVAAYAELNYDIPLGGAISVDGVLGGRFTQTKRSILTFKAVTAAGVTTYTPITADTTDRDFLPTATARIKLGGGLQARLGYAKSIRRPNFTDLNPAVTLAPSNNPFVQSGGSAGNPSLKEQKSDSYDATIEYYFHGGYVSAAGYYRNITNRVLSGSAIESFGGVDYSISRPRNLGAASLKGLELSGQYFFDGLPGPAAGLGLQGAFTLADSEIKGSDPLAGNPLQGVSKYNYTAGLLYEKYGISGRLVYTYRSKYFDSDQSGSINVRPIASDQVNTVFVPSSLSYVRPAGRLDFNVGYDINKAIRVDVGGTNILHNKTKDYLDQPFENFEAFYDETTYSIGLRVRL